MLIWANKNEINTEIINPIEAMYSKGLGMENVGEELKAWELSIILRQINRHFGERKDISILDFGAGVSPFGAYLNHIGYDCVTCLDIKDGWHPEIDQEAYNEKYGAHVKYLKTDILQGHDGGKYDVIFSASVLEHMRNIAVKVLQSLSIPLKSDGLFIHVVDYNMGMNFKQLIDSCGIPISYKPEETPGCEEFKAPPKYIWLNGKKSRIAFFNEKETT